MNKTDEGWRGPVLRYAPVLVWVGIIFLLSSPEGSMQQTSRFLRPLLQFIFPAADEATLQIYHGYIRKSAHVTEYAILAILAARAFSAAKPLLRSFWFVWAIGLVISVASLDEFNQSFEPSRTSTPWDVALDVAGGVLGAVLFFAIRGLLERRRLRG
jgi:VanZ family protein